MDIGSMKDAQLKRLLKSRWDSASSLWDTIKSVYDRTTTYYDADPDRVPEHVRTIPAKSHRVRANRIFRNSESVINSIIANPPKPNVIPERGGEGSKSYARRIEKFLVRKYVDLDVKSELRRGLRYLYFSRLVVLKPYWDPKTNDFAVTAIDPRKVRFSPKATKEIESDWAIEEIECGVNALLSQFPEKKADILKQCGMTEEEAYISDRQVTYKESWIGDWVVRTYGEVILGKTKNPYWDWDGILLSDESKMAMEDTKNPLPPDFMKNARATDDGKRPEGSEPYLFNHFDRPRKPYIFATVLSDEKCPIGRTSFIEQAIPLQESVDRRKRQIDDNARMVNGITKVDSSVMGEAEARKLRYDPEGLIWGKGVVAGVQRETGTPLPSFIFEDMVDSRNEIDNIMAASSAFRGEREGAETKAGRLALIEQSYMGLNELVQVVDFMSSELFNWFVQLVKVNYTETHYLKSMGPDGAYETMEMTRDDLVDGVEIKVISGKTIPEDRRFRFERALGDKDVLALTDYFEEAGYDDPKGLAMRAVAMKADPFAATGVEPPPPPTIPTVPGTPPMA